ncbi:hypothetical protein V6C27_06785 [Peptococcaceae bacterium 1198_IL3148]
MITASREIFYNVMMGEWKGLNVKLVHISSDAEANSKVFRLDNFVFDEVEACENCQAPASQCDACDGFIEILALVGTITINKRKIEDGFVIPLLGDVIFDLREGLLSILTDTDVVVISRAGENIDHKITGTITNKKGNRVNRRLYLMTESKVKRVAVTALQDGRLFPDLAGKKAIVADINYVHENKSPIYLDSLRLYYVYFDENGKVNEELTFPRRNQPQDDVDQNQYNDKVVAIGRRDKQPELSKKQKELVKERLLKDFGEEVWSNTPMRVKALLE